MAEIKEFKPPTKERPKPEKSDVIPHEELRRRKQELDLKRLAENPDLTIADLYDLLQSGDISKEQLDKMNFITDNERFLLKICADLLWGLKQKDQ